MPIEQSVHKLFYCLGSNLCLCKATSKVCVGSLLTGRAGRVVMFPDLLRLSLE